MSWPNNAINVPRRSAGRLVLEFCLLVACAFCFLLYAEGAWTFTWMFLVMWL